MIWKLLLLNRQEKMVKEHIPYEIKYAINCVMEQIKNDANDGNSGTEFDSSEPYYYTMKSKKFKDFIESLGYKYKLCSTEKWGCYTERITISW